MILHKKMTYLLEEINWEIQKKNDNIIDWLNLFF